MRAAILSISGAISGACSRIAFASVRALHRKIPPFHAKFPAARNRSAVVPIRLLAKAPHPPHRHRSVRSGASSAPARHTRSRSRSASAARPAQRCSLPPPPARCPPRSPRQTRFHLHHVVRRKHPDHRLGSCFSSRNAVSAHAGAVFRAQARSEYAPQHRRHLLAIVLRSQPFVTTHTSSAAPPAADAQRLLNHRALAIQRQHLLRPRPPAPRPEPRSTATRQDHRRKTNLVSHRLHGSKQSPSYST